MRVRFREIRQRCQTVASRLIRSAISQGRKLTRRPCERDLVIGRSLGRLDDLE